MKEPDLFVREQKKGMPKVPSMLYVPAPCHSGQRVQQGPEQT